MSIVSLSDYRARKARRTQPHGPVDALAAWQSPELLALFKHVHGGYLPNIPPLTAEIVQLPCDTEPA